MSFIDDADQPARRRFWPLAVTILLAFVAGAIAMGYALTHWEVAARFLPHRDAAVTPPVRVIASPPPPVTVLSPPSTTALDAVDGRVADLEGRIGALDTQARAASANADRAEALLVAFAARRAIDRGVALGYLEALLRERFGAAQPQAVATVIAAARQPQTLDELHAGLSAAAPALSGADPAESGWARFRREMADLIVIRRTNVPASTPTDRVARALVQIEAGHVDRALVEIARLPSRAAAAAWLAAARRYVAAHQALDAIEANALLAPRASSLAPSLQASVDEPQP